MESRSMRWWVLGVLLCLLAAQVHVCLESRAVQSTPHQCPVCKAGAWAMPATGPGLQAAHLSAPLVNELSLPLARLLRAELSTPRAPPQA